MMARALAFAMLLAAAGAQHCSSVCGTCCPGADLVIDDTGDCWRGAQLVCRVATAACKAGTAAEQCPSVGVADISITEPDNVAGLPPGVVIASAVGRQVPVDAVDSFLRDGQAVWEKLALAATGGNVAALHNVPTYYVGRFQVKMPVKTRLRAGSVVRYLCPDMSFFGIPATPCHVVVLLYECYPCPSRKGGLPQHLLTEGFARTRCAPTFTNGRTRTEHPLGAYVKMIQPGITEVIVLPEVVEFVMFALSYGGAVDCATLKTKLGCTLLSHNFCVWRGSCEMNMCVQQGPSKDPVSPGRGGCNTRVCLKKELRRQGGSAHPTPPHPPTRLASAMQGALQGAALCGCRAAPRRLAASPSATGRRRVSLPVPERPDKPRTIFDEDYQAERATPVPSRWQTLLAQKTQEGTRQPAAGSRSKELLKRDTGGDIERVTNALVSDTGSRFTATVSSQGRDVMRRLLATEDTAHPHTRTARPKRSPDLPVLADLPISQWPFPGDQESSIVRYDNPRPSHFLGNPRPSVQDAVDSGRADLLAKVLETDAFLEREGDGMGSRWDPTCQLLDGSINHTSSKEMWVVHAEAEGVAQAPPADARHTAHTDSAERRLRLARREATPLGHALAESAGHDLVRLLVENTMCNPNLTIVIHDAEPLGCGTAPAPAGGGRGALLRRNRVPIAERPAAVQRGSGGAAAPAYGTVEVSPLYYCLALGHTEAADLLLRHPSLDPRIGYFSKDPRSVVKPLRCSHLRPELAEAEAALDRQDAATVTHGLVERADMHRSLLDFMSAPRRSLGSDVQKAQLFSVGIGKI